jgi:hypothetical protein
MSRKLRIDDASITADRRAVLFGLGATAAAASFAPFMTAAPAAALAPAALGAPVPAVFWNLGYTDFTGVVPAWAPPARAPAGGRDLDPHAELLGR